MRTVNSSAVELTWEYGWSMAAVFLACCCAQLFYLQLNA